jgi:hypothetical protein
MRTYDDSFSGQKIYPGKVRPAGARPSPCFLRHHMSRFRTAHTYATPLHGRHMMMAEATRPLQLTGTALTVTTGQALHPW